MNSITCPASFNWRASLKCRYEDRLGVCPKLGSLQPPQTFDRTSAEHNSVGIPVLTRQRLEKAQVRPDIHGTGDGVDRAIKLCSTEHRKAFWTAARRWTMRAIEAGLPPCRLIA